MICGKLHMTTSAAEMVVKLGGGLIYVSTARSGTTILLKVNGQLTMLLKVLALLVTASEHRRKGAGSLLLRWGIERAEEMGLPCYLQASEEGKRLYEKHDFQVTDVREFDLSEYGLEGVEIMTEMMRQPSKRM